MPQSNSKDAPYYLRLRIRLMQGNGVAYKGIYRTVDVLSTVTFDELHGIIFDLFDRYDEHLYEFRLGTRSPWRGDPFIISSTSFDYMDDEPDLSAEETTLGSMGFEQGSYFFYWFDFGDDWMHKISVSSFRPAKKGDPRYKIVQIKGDSPPQYPEFDEEDE